MSKRSRTTKIKLTGSPSHHRCKQDQSEGSEQHLGTPEEIIGTSNALGKKGKYKIWN